MLTRGRRIGALALLLASTLGGEAGAGSCGGQAVVVPRPSRFEPYRFFADRTATVPLRVHAPDAEGLGLRAQLVQLTADLAAPVGAELDVPLPRGGSARRGIDVELAVPLPAVTRETDFELWIRSRREGDTVWVTAGRIGLRVYPADLLGPVRRWATAHPLRVEADDDSLLGFLREQRIPVVGSPGARGSGDGRGVTLYAGPRTLRKGVPGPPREGEASVVFTERPTDTPRLLIERAGRGTTVTVEMRLLDRLATDPLAQKIFREVFEIVHEEKSSRGGDVR